MMWKMAVKWGKLLGGSNHKCVCQQMRPLPPERSNQSISNANTRDVPTSEVIKEESVGGTAKVVGLAVMKDAPIKPALHEECVIGTEGSLCAATQDALTGRRKKGCA